MVKERNDILHKVLMWLAISGITVGGIAGIIWAASAKSSKLEAVDAAQIKMAVKVDEHDQSITTLKTDVKWIRGSLHRIESKLGIGDDKSARDSGPTRNSDTQ